MNTGKFDRRVVIVAPGAPTSNEWNEETSTPVRTPAWAAMFTAPGTERFQNAENAANAPLRFRFRWREGLVEPTHVIEYAGQLYDVKSVEEIGRRKELVAITVARLAGPVPQIVPLAISDFAGGVYSIGGVAKTVGDLWIEDATNWASFDPAVDIVAGVGLTVPPTAEGGNCGPVSSPGLFAALNDPGVNGLTFVVEYIITTTGPPVAANGVEVTMNQLPDYTVDLALFEFHTHPTNGLFVKDSVSGAANINDHPATPGIARKIACSFCQEYLAFSANGAAVDSTVDPIADLSSATTFALWISMSASSQGVLSRIAFYPLQPVADLALLSA